MVEEARQLAEDDVQIMLVDQGDIKVRLGEILPVLFNTPLERLDVTRMALYGWKAGWIKPMQKKRMPLVNCRV
jgi:hypothetical protein